MLEIRFHGRGGQGAVTSAEILAQAAILEGKYARAFPTFGPERRGAPVAAFCRIDDKPVRLRTAIEKPAIVIVLDPSLVKSVDVAAGLDDNGLLVINSEKNPRLFTFERLKRVAAVDATKIALETLNRPLTNTIMLGALLKVSPVVAMESVVEAIKHRFNEKIARLNMEALDRALVETRVLGGACEDGTAKTAYR